MIIVVLIDRPIVARALDHALNALSRAQVFELGTAQPQDWPRLACHFISERKANADLTFILFDLRRGRQLEQDPIAMEVAFEVHMVFAVPVLAWPSELPTRSGGKSLEDGGGQLRLLSDVACPQLLSAIFALARLSTTLVDRSSLARFAKQTQRDRLDSILHELQDEKPLPRAVRDASVQLRDHAAVDPLTMAALRESWPGLFTKLVLSSGEHLQSFGDLLTPYPELKRAAEEFASWVDDALRNAPAVTFSPNRGAHQLARLKDRLGRRRLQLGGPA